MRQPTFFDKSESERAPDLERLALYALGEFQARGKLLAERELPLDRLRGALRRAAAAFGVEEPEDEAAASALTGVGARVRRVPTFFAKHPFRVLVSKELAERALRFFNESAAPEG